MVSKDSGDDVDVPVWSSESFPEESLAEELALNLELCWRPRVVAGRFATLRHIVAGHGESVRGATTHVAPHITIFRLQRSSLSD